MSLVLFWLILRDHTRQFCKNDPLVAVSVFILAGMPHGS
jgi:hypothetical protein